MSANELQNHLEAVCWLRNGPNPGEGVLGSPIQYLRSASGFEDKIALVNGIQGASATVMLLLDRPYSRSETAVFCTVPTTGDVSIIDGAPVFAQYPIVPLVVPTLIPIDRRVFLDPPLPPPATPADAAAVFEIYDAILVIIQDSAEGEPVYADLCVAVVRNPKKEGETEIITLNLGP